MSGAQFAIAGGAFLLAWLWSAIAMPAAVDLGRRWGMVARPRLFGRRRRRTISYLGGLTLAGAATVGFLFAGGVPAGAGPVLAGGLLLLFLGFADDRSTRGGLPPGFRLLIQALVATGAWWGGLRAGVFGAQWLDGLITVFFLVAAANAFNLLDNMDGVAGASAAVVAAGLFGLAALGGQHLVATLAASLCGASLGFLRHNLVRARVYLGDGGALFLGFLLGAAALKLRLPLPPPSGLVVLIAAFAVPAADTTLVILSRLLAGRPVFQGGVDHISHRLVRLGLSPRGAVVAHAGGSAVGAAAAAFAVVTGRPGAALAVIVVFAAAGLALLRVRVYEEEPRRLRRRVVAALGLGLIVAVIPAMATAALVREDLARAREHMLAARSALRAVSPEGATQALDRAEEALVRAERRLTSWPTLPGRLVPGVRGNLRAATALVRSGRELAAAGRESVAVVKALPFEDGRLVAPWSDGAVDPGPFSRAAGPAARVRAHVARAERLLRSSGGILLLPQLRDARQEALGVLAEARRQAEVAAAATRIIPRAFAADGSRTWLLGAENTAELRGRGGYIGSLGVVEADHGRLRLARFLPTSQLPALDLVLGGAAVPEEYRQHYRRLGGLGAWANLAMSPNFPSGARLLLSRLEASGGPKASGLVAMDPTALAYLLEVTGPVEVEGIPEPLTVGNVVDWSLNRIYFEYEGSGEERKERLADIAQAVWGRVISGEVDPARLAESLGRALAGRHLVVYSADPREQALIEQLGIAGKVEGTDGDYLLVLGQNYGENKMDYYLQREVTYRGEVAADGAIDARLEVTVRNTAPADVSLPDAVGGARPRLKLEAGHARSYLSVFVPGRAILQNVLIDGTPTTNFDNRVELGKRMFATYVEVAPGGSQKVAFQYRVPDVLVAGRYRLTLQNQATVHPDEVSLRVAVPPGAVIDLREGFVRGKTLVWKGALTSDLDLAAEVEVPLTARIAHEVASLLRRPVFRLTLPSQR